jgi:hypothetical protein
VKIISLFSCFVITYVYTFVKQNKTKMEYTEKEIATAKANYTAWLKFRTVESYDIHIIGSNAAHWRCDAHNAAVRAILNGDKAVEREWKLSFLELAVKQTMAAGYRKSKRERKAAKDAKNPYKQLTDDQKTAYLFWLKDENCKYHRESISRVYTGRSVAAFLESIK